MEDKICNCAGKRDQKIKDLAFLIHCLKHLLNDLITFAHGLAHYKAKGVNTSSIPIEEIDITSCKELFTKGGWNALLSFILATLVGYEMMGNVRSFLQWSSPTC